MSGDEQPNEKSSMKMEGPPPTYTENGGDAEAAAVPPNYSNEAPPSYNSVFGRMQSMRDESEGNVDFGKKLVGCVLCGTVCNLLTVVVMLAIPIACIVFGALYKDDCPRQNYIPIYLIVAGTFGILKAVIGSVQMVIRHRHKAAGGSEEEQPSGMRATQIADGPITCFISCWFIAGSVWVYRIHKDYSDIPSDPDYCNPTLYTFAFWIITVQYIIGALMLFCCCVGLLVACCCLAKKSDS